MQLPLMPKGVEHLWGLLYLPCSYPMQLPLMPKGVEHTFTSLSVAGSRICNYL